MKFAARSPRRAASDASGPVSDLPPGVETLDGGEVGSGDDHRGSAIGGGYGIGEGSDERVGACGLLDECQRVRRQRRPEKPNPKNQREP